MRNQSKILTLFSLVVFFGYQGIAKDFYVRAGASGSNNGTDWNNAWSDVTKISWSSVSAGDKIWIAGGTYGQLTIGKSGTSGSPIYIARVRSTNSTPASTAGWNAAYDSQVVLNLVDDTAAFSYWTLDGQVPYSGILVTNTSVGISGNPFAVNFSNGAGTAPASYVTLLNLNISCSITDNSSFSNPNETRCVNWNFGSPSHGFVMSYCILAYCPTLCSFIGAWDTATITHNKFTQNNNGGNSSHHKNVIQSTGGTNVVFAFNQIYNWANEGLMFDPIGANDPPNDGWDIYGNLIYWDWEGVARFPESQNRAQYRIRIYNNTFVDLGLATIRTANNGSWGAGCATSNNIVMHCGSTSGTAAGIGFGLGTDDYNYSDASLAGSHSISSAKNSIFANYSGRDYHLVSTAGARDKGATLPAQYAIDFDGNTRGADGAWDIGAFEYSGSVTSSMDTTPPSVSLTTPTVNANVSGITSLSATATDNSGGTGVASVSFLVDGVTIGTDTTSPYTLNWNSTLVANGPHSIQALAVDGAGNQATSASVNVTVSNTIDTTPPTVNVTAPLAGSTVSNTVTVTATASDNSGGSGLASITLFVDGVAIGSNSSSPCSITWNSQSVANGSHTIQAKALDAVGNQTTSSGVTVTVQNPVVTLLTDFVGYWPFDDAGTMAVDDSGNGNNGTLVGDATWGVGRLQGALALDGGTGYVQVPSTPNLEQVSNAVTICCWVKLGTNIAYSVGNMQDIARKVVDPSTNLPPYSAYDLVVQDFGNGTFKPRMAVTRATDSTRGTSGWGAAHTYGSWYFLAGVYDGALVHIYVNGVEEANTAFSGPILQTFQPLCIGRYGTVGEAANGLIDDLRIYSRPLSAAEIQTLFNVSPPSGSWDANLHAMPTTN